MFKIGSLFGKRNGKSEKTESISDNIFTSLIDGSGPITLDHITEIKRVPKSERSRLICGLKNSQAFHAFMYEMLVASKDAEESGIDDGKFLGAKELFHAARIVFLAAKVSLPSDDVLDAESDPAETFIRKATAKVFGRKNKRQWKGLSDYKKDKWDEMLQKAEALKKGV